MYELAWHPDALCLNSVLTAGNRFFSPGPPSYSPDGHRLSFVWAGNGRNQIWLQKAKNGVAMPASHHPVVVEPTDGTDRRDVGGGPQWSSDSKRLAFVGENRHRQGKTSIITMEVASGEIHQLTDHPASDRTPRWSPDGQWIAYVVAWDEGTEEVAIVSANGGSPIQLTVDRHANTDLAWSPDSQLIAYSTQRRDEHRFEAGIAFVEIKNGAIHFVDNPPGANERMPRFSPDGRYLAFVSDRDGFDSVWLYDMQRETLRKLAVGDREVSHPAWAPDGQRIAFALTQGVWSRIACVTLADGSLTWLSPSVGSAFWPTWSPSGAEVAYAWSDACTPMEIWSAEVGTAERQQVTHTAPLTLPKDSLIRPERISYTGANGLKIDALLYRPEREQASPGGILFVHGGPNSVTRELFDPFLQYLVAVEGYTILAPNVRGSTGYGLEYMELNIGDYGGLDQRDWIAAVDTLTQRGGVDKERVAIWGRSYGGFATMLSLCQYPDIFCCGVAQFGVSDWHSLWDQSIPWVRRLMSHQLGHPEKDRELYVERSPLTHVEHIQAPILLLHGDADKGVPDRQSLQFAERLQAKNHPYELKIYPGEGHGFNERHHIVDAARRIAAFFDRYLRRTTER